MGIPAFNIAASVVLIVAQRLVRRLCACKKTAQLSADTLRQTGFTEQSLASGFQPFQANGCEHCNGSGYRGRIAIYQMLPITAIIENLILSQRSTQEIELEARRQGMQSLRSAGLRKVMDGITSLDEVLACTNP
jgi:type IV pilus assembly protein PilB